MGTHIIRGNTRLADQYPALVAHMEEGREGIAVSVHRLLCHGSVVREHLLIAGFRAGETDHRVTLWRDERRRTLREPESRVLLLDDDALRVVLLIPQDGVSEGDIVVCHEESDHHLLPSLVLQRDIDGVRLEVDMRGLGA